uniref:4Fe-4S ferredoxin-type domain-containing protein n=1 Tax=Taenia asiatica TaxID=60517 RepID=A0A0R3WFV7_TAEAS
LKAPCSCHLVAFFDILCVLTPKVTVGKNRLPGKLNVAIELDANSVLYERPQCGWRLELCALRARGETSGQQSQKSRTTADKTVVEQLQSMGFTCDACLDACPAAASGTETALSVTVETSSLAAPPEMDITADLAKRAVEARDNKVKVAINMAFSNPDALLALPSRCNKAVPHQ